MTSLGHAIRAAISPVPAPEVDPRPRDPRDTDETPLVSIVTICLNRRDTIARTIDSVRAQTYRNIEYIVLDGGSDDGTVEIIRANEDVIDEWRSGRDGGLYDALNEGVRRAKGRFVQFVHSDDWLEPDQIERAVAAARTIYADIVHGDLAMHREDGTVWERIGRDDWYPLRPAEIPQIWHPTVLARRRAFERAGLFRTDLRVAADVDWFLRCVLEGLIVRHDPSIRSNMSEGGVSTRRQRLALAEYAAILLRGSERRLRLVLGALWLLGTTVPALRPILVTARRWRIRVLNLILRAGSGARRFLAGVVRGTPLGAVVARARAARASLTDGSAPRSSGRGSILARFAAIRHAEPAADDAEILERARRDILGDR